MRTIVLEGTPRSLGEAHGELLRREIAELYDLRLRNALEQARLHGGRHAAESDLLALARASAREWEPFDPEGFAELSGIARGADLSVEQVVALGGLTDLRDALAWGAPPPGDCTAFLVQRDASEDGRIWMGQTWDLATDNAPFVVALHRRPAAGPETWSVTTAGCFTLMGLSDRGLAVGTTNLRTRDARPGVPYVGILHRLLGARDFAEAVQLICAAPRAGGHVYLLADREGNAAALETTALRVGCVRLAAGFHVHTNHCQLPRNREVEADTPRDSSEARLARMSRLLGHSRSAIAPEDMRRFLCDREGGKLAICRDDFDGISTNAAWLACPEARFAGACAGLPDRSPWVPLGPHAASETLFGR
ncbi:MAG: C45 family autoproteolytic acyltransferase/hydrolase [Myxococcota bacterium]|nr:C45 family autoproteolytic acyltransferase/hydrolase [Myxococcota bacterium]